MNTVKELPEVENLIAEAFTLAEKVSKKFQSQVIEGGALHLTQPNKFATKDLSYSNLERGPHYINAVLVEDRSDMDVSMWMYVATNLEGFQLQIDCRGSNGKFEKDICVAEHFNNPLDPTEVELEEFELEKGFPYMLSEEFHSYVGNLQHTHHSGDPFDLDLEHYVGAL